MVETNSNKAERSGLFAKVALLIAFAVHGVLTFYAFVNHGYAGYFPPFAQSNTTQIFSDLVIALTLVNCWVFVDVERRGLPRYWFGVHVVGTALLGSFAPLTYLLVRQARA